MADGRGRAPEPGRRKPRGGRPSGGAGGGRASDVSSPAGQRPSRGTRPRHSDPARRAAFDVLRAVATSDAYANLVLPPLLAERGIRGRDAAFAT